jgi:hypothetical protein
MLDLGWLVEFAGALCGPSARILVAVAHMLIELQQGDDEETGAQAHRRLPQ